MAKRNDGKLLEKATEWAGKRIVQAGGFFHTFPDSRRARNLISAQPSDFLLAHLGVALLLECKSTAASASLVSMINANDQTRAQAGKHRLWHNAGMPSGYLYLDLQLGRLAWYDGEEAVKAAAGSRADRAALRPIAGAVWPLEGEAAQGDRVRELVVVAITTRYRSPS